MSSGSEVVDGVGTMTGEEEEVEVFDNFLVALAGKGVKAGDDFVLSWLFMGQVPEKAA